MIGMVIDNWFGIFGEDCLGSHSVTEFVVWYNGYLDFVDHEFDFGCMCVVVIGNGNVVVDVVWMLVLDFDEVVVIDMVDHVIELLVQCSVNEVIVFGCCGLV